MKIVLSKYKQEQWYLGILFSFFLLGEQIRRGIYEPLSLNLVFVVCLMLILFINRNNLYSKKLVVISIISIHATIINIVNGCSMNTVIRCFVVLYLPLYLFSINYENINIDYRYLVYKCIKWFNRFIYLMFAIYLFDILTNGIIVKLLSSHLLYSVKNWVPKSFGFFSMRYPSFMGHYLYTGELYLIFFILNSSYKIKTKEWVINPEIIYIVYIVGTLSTASKTCTVLMLVMIIINNFWGRNKIIKATIAIGSIGVIYSLGAFNFIISRLEIGADITTGRTDAWNYLEQSGGLKPSIIGGYGFTLKSKWEILLSSIIGNSTTVSRQASIALEYPIISNFFRFGILNNILLIGYMIYFPVRRFLKSKNTYLAICSIILFVDINTFNLLTEGMDAMTVYVWTIMIMSFIEKIRIQEKITTLYK